MHLRAADDRRLGPFAVLAGDLGQRLGLLMREQASLDPRRSTCAEHRIAHDGEQPRLGIVPAEALEAVPGAQEGVMHDVFGDGFVAAEEAREVVGAVQVRQHQPPESLPLGVGGRRPAGGLGSEGQDASHGRGQLELSL